MDIEIVPEDPGIWRIQDELGYSYGRIVKEARGYVIEQDEGFLSTVDRGPFTAMHIVLLVLEEAFAGRCLVVIYPIKADH